MQIRRERCRHLNHRRTSVVVDADVSRRTRRDGLSIKRGPSNVFQVPFGIVRCADKPLAKGYVYRSTPSVRNRPARDIAGGEKIPENMG